MSADRGTLVVAVEGQEKRPFLDRLAGLKPEIDRRMEEAIARKADGEIARHFQGGKRLRAGTTLMMFEALSNSPDGRDMALDLAAAVEFAHGISLMIDDLLDGDPVRRGAASVQTSKGPAFTVLEVVRLLSVPYSLAGPHGSGCTGHLADVHEEMVRGAMAEMRTVERRPSLAEYDRLISMKSGRLFELAARFGGLAAGCCEEKAALAGAYGRSLGAVHQISDDIVDLADALAMDRSPTGSEAFLFRCMVTDGRDRDSAIGRGKLPSEVENELGRELQCRVRRAERAAKTIASSVGRCGNRRSLREQLSILLSAPSEVAEIMMPPGEAGRYLLGRSEDRS